MSIAVNESLSYVIRPSHDDLRALMRSPGLCASILMNTTPANRMAEADRRRLEALCADADRRLHLETGHGEASRVARRLHTLKRHVIDGPTDRSLAIFANSETLYAFHLPRPLEERVVIDPTFATRDIVEAVQESPPFLLLHVDSRSASLYRHNQKYLEPVLSPDFPALREGRVRADRDLERTRAFLRNVDAGVGRELSDSAMPLVLVGGDRIVAEFLRLTAHGGRIAGIHRGNRRRASLAQLEEIGRRIVSDHVEDLKAAALDTLDASMGAGRAVWGLLGSWHACATRTPELLLVERGFRVPARTVAEGRYVEPAEDCEAPGVIDDAVDDLIENVLHRGGFVAVVPDGTLRQHGRVAMILTR